jgi:hypothetical protein
MQRLGNLVLLLWPPDFVYPINLFPLFTYPRKHNPNQWAVEFRYRPMGCFTCPRFTPVQWRTSEGTNASHSDYPPFLSAFDWSCSEDLNVLVKRHIQAVVSAAPSRALATLENDAAELIAQGMVTVNAKLKGVEDEKLVARVVEVWGFFWDQVLTYLEGVREST